MKTPGYTTQKVEGCLGDYRGDLLFQLRVGSVPNWLEVGHPRMTSPAVTIGANDTPEKFLQKWKYNEWNLFNDNTIWMRINNDAPESIRIACERFEDGDDHQWVMDTLTHEDQFDGFYLAIKIDEGDVVDIDVEARYKN